MVKLANQKITAMHSSLQPFDKKLAFE